MYEKNILSLSPFPPSSAKASKPFTTCYFPFAPRFPHGSGEQMSDNGMGEPVGCVPPASICLFLFGASVRLVESKCCLSQGILPFSWPSRVVFTWPIKYVKPPVFSPDMYNKKVWLQLLLHPKGNFQNSSPPHLSEMKLSRFLRSAEICLLILNHTRSHWMHDQDKCLSYLFMSLEVTPRGSDCRGACSVNREFTDHLDQLISKANLEGKWDNCG